MAAKLCLLRKDLYLQDIMDIVLAHAVSNYTDECLESKRSACFQLEFPDNYKLHYKVAFNIKTDEPLATVEAFIETDEEKSEEDTAV